MTQKYPSTQERYTGRTHEVPHWVPHDAQMYLAHTEAGYPIRALARATGNHASTILRQIRRIETRRDDPLVDAALRHLGQARFTQDSRQLSTTGKADKTMSFHEKISPSVPGKDVLDDTRFMAEAARVLRRLCEKGAVLAVAAEMENAVIVRDDAGGAALRTGVVAREVAEAMALKDWISAQKSGKITRYTITPSGRAAIEDILSERQEAENPGFAESQNAFTGADRLWGTHEASPFDTGRARRVRYNLAESPLTALARRRDKNGEKFLSEELVSAGEQLREDFELAQMGPQISQNWDRFLTAAGRETFVPDSGVGHGPSAARARVADALQELGPGLSDVALRCCCYLEGLETAEKKMGWSARSGKIVLRIALMRLKRHYDETVGPGGPLIG